MKKLVFSFILLFAFAAYTEAQFSKYIVRLKDKTGTSYSVNNPLEFLSARSIQRRIRQNIAVDETDLPVNNSYIDSIRSAGNVIVLSTSKWLNQVCIETTDQAALTKINAFPFVESAEAVRRPLLQAATNNNKLHENIREDVLRPLSPSVTGAYNYGATLDQVHIHEGEFLHNNGFHGEGMLLAIMDAGFYHYKSNPVFDSVRNNNQVAETYDFVANETSVDEDNAHGMYCLSIIAANSPGKIVGSCPGATYYLYRTEDASSEYPVEEHYWAAAAERADSIGVDVFSTSLGYSTFDNSIFDHSYTDLDGNKTMIARACDLAAKKGIISVVSAGNEGSSTWHFISTPADADSALAVGAVNSSGTPAGFSSYGPSADGQVKPTVASVGEGTAIANINGEPAFGDGTSFAAPNMAGLVTCLWQAFPDFTNMEIIQAVIKSSSLYTSPNDRLGYGIPNFHKAFDDLTAQRNLRNNPVVMNNWIKIYPNPFKRQFNVLINPQRSGTVTLKLFDTAGKLYHEKQVDMQPGQLQLVEFDKVQPLAQGIYILKYDDGVNKKSIRIVAK